MTHDAGSSGEAWNPDQYAKFRDERSQPFFDLLDLVEPIPGGRAIDLGCGTGELTKVLHERSGARATIGLDNSESMLEKSEQYAGNGLTFKLGTILRFAPQTPFHLIFANASLQWVPDHPKLFERLAAGLLRGGQLAVQMPANHDHPSHVIADGLAREAPFAETIGGAPRQWPVMPPERYAALLDRLGFEDILVRLQIYMPKLESREGVVEWVKGTYLTYYQQRMPADLYEEYLRRYREELMKALPDERPFLYTYKRILMWARRPGGA
jgi:trans-aconitate 2-methyltransferase